MTDVVFVVLVGLVTLAVTAQDRRRWLALAGLGLLGLSVLVVAVGVLDPSPPPLLVAAVVVVAGAVGARAGRRRRSAPAR